MYRDTYLCYNTSERCTYYNISVKCYSTTPDWGAPWTWSRGRKVQPRFCFWWSLWKTPKKDDVSSGGRDIQPNPTTQTIPLSPPDHLEDWARTCWHPKPSGPLERVCFLSPESKLNMGLNRAAFSFHAPHIRNKLPKSCRPAASRQEASLFAFYQIK